MFAAILLSIISLALIVLPVLVGADTRDGRDSQAPSEWTARRGAPWS